MKTQADVSQKVGGGLILAGLVLVFTSLLTFPGNSALARQRDNITVASTIESTTASIAEATAEQTAELPAKPSTEEPLVDPPNRMSPTIENTGEPASTVLPTQTPPSPASTPIPPTPAPPAVMSPPTAEPSPGPTGEPTATPEANHQDLTIPVSPARPVVILVHGWQGFGNNNRCRDGITPYPHNQHFRVQNPDSVTGSLPDWLAQDGFEVWSAHLDSGPDYTAPLKDNARCLSHQIAQVRDRAPGGQVILIAHSMGGVVARAYIEDGALFQNDVKTLFTLGSPHQGVPYKIVKYIDRFHLNKITIFDRLSCAKDKQAAMCELLDKNMTLFNQTHPHRARGVSYYLISGDLPFRQATLWGRIVSAWAKGPDDGFIQIASGLNLDGVHQTLQTHEAHTDSFGSRTYFVAPPGESHSIAYANCIQPVLQGDPDGCYPSRAQTAVRPPDPSFNALIPIVEGTLSSAQQMAHPINLDRSGDAFFAAVWESGPVSFILTRPDGQTIDPAYAATYPDEVNYVPAEPDTLPAGAGYFIPRARAGRWSVHLKAGDLPGRTTNYGVLITLESAITLDVAVDKSQYAPGQTALIQARLGGEVTEANIEVQIERPDGFVDTLTLTPQQNGTYSGAYTIPSLPGYVTLTALAQGKDSQEQTFSREAVIDCQIQASPESPPATALIAGRVLLQSRPGHSGTHIYLLTDEEQCRPTSNDASGTPDAVTDANGYFEITPPPGQTYECLKATHHRYLTGQKLALQGNLGPITLPGGDVTGDNLIDIFDLSYIATHYDSADPTADANADGLIDIFDLTIVGGNFGQRKPVWWP